jgi:dUTP pyrophosphatase
MALPKLQMRRVRPNADLALPHYQTAGASGLDLRADVHEPVTLKPLQRALIPTGLALAIPQGYEGQVRARSGLALKNGIALVNAPGTIDADYRGELQVILINLSDQEFVINRGDRIAQLVIQTVCQPSIVEVESLDNTERGEGGFGSTGV